MRELQEQMLQAMLGAIPPCDSALMIYRESIHSSLQKTLSLLFTVTKKAYEEFSLGPTWEQLGENFITQFWPKDFRLNWTFEKFSDWLSIDPWLKELANYEWARFFASSSRDPNAEEWINPSLVLRYYQYQIPKWYKEREEKTQRDVPQAGFSAVAIFRDFRTARVRTLELQPAAFDLLSQWRAGDEPERIAELLAAQLDQSVEEIMLQMDLLMRKLEEESVLLHLGRKNTRYFRR